MYCGFSLSSYHFIIESRVCRDAEVREMRWVCSAQAGFPYKQSLFTCEGNKESPYTMWPERTENLMAQGGSASGSLGISSLKAYFCVFPSPP